MMIRASAPVSTASTRRERVDLASSMFTVGISASLARPDQANDETGSLQEERELLRLPGDRLSLLPVVITDAVVAAAFRCRGGQPIKLAHRGRHLPARPDNRGSFDPAQCQQQYRETDERPQRQALRR